MKPTETPVVSSSKPYKGGGVVIPPPGPSRMSLQSYDSRGSAMQAFPPPIERDSMELSTDTPLEGAQRVAALRMAKKAYDNQPAAQQMRAAGVVTAMDPEQVQEITAREDMERKNMQRHKDKSEQLREEIASKTKRMTAIKWIIISLFICLIGTLVTFAVLQTTNKP